MEKIQSDRELAELQTIELMDLLQARAGLLPSRANLNQGAVPKGLIALVLDCLRDPAWLAQGEAISRITRLPFSRHKVEIARLLAGETPYQQFSPALLSRLKNMGTRPCDVVTRVEMIPVKRVGSKYGFCDSPCFQTKIICHSLAPGETIDLGWEKAALALYDFGGQTAYHPEQWASPDGLLDAGFTGLREIGYTAAFPDPLTGEEVVVESDSWQLGADAKPFTTAGIDVPATSDPAADAAASKIRAASRRRGAAA